MTQPATSPPTTRVPPEEPPEAPGSRPATAGFTLIEVTVAVAILAVLAFSTLLILVPVSREHRLTRESDVAVAVARNLLEQVYTVPFNDLLDRFPPGQVIPVAGLDGGQIQISYEDTTADPIVMQADLSWNSADYGPMARSFFTVRTE